MKEKGGVVLTYVGTIQIEMKSELGYDNSGRPHVKRQTFTHAAKSYDIEYSDHAYDKSGRLAGYKIEVRKAE